MPYLKLKSTQRLAPTGKSTERLTANREAHDLILKEIAAGRDTVGHLQDLCGGMGTGQRKDDRKHRPEYLAYLGYFRVAE